jgi:hypothetical protein
LGGATPRGTWGCLACPEGHGPWVEGPGSRARRGSVLPSPMHWACYSDTPPTPHLAHLCTRAAPAVNSGWFALWERVDTAAKHGYGLQVWPSAQRRRLPVRCSGGVGGDRIRQGESGRYVRSSRTYCRQVQQSPGMSNTVFFRFCVRFPRTLSFLDEICLEAGE